MLAIAAGPAGAIVQPRDLNRQLELCGAAHEGRVVFGRIASAEVKELPAISGVPYTILTLEPQRSLTGDALPKSIRVYVPGAGESRLSISPPESETRVGESVLYFVRADATIRAVEPGAWHLDSFAEAFRTQLNKKGAVVVLGEGRGSAIEENATLDSLETQVRAATQALRGAGK